MLCSLKGAVGDILEEPAVVEMAKKYKKTPAQVIQISYNNDYSLLKLLLYEHVYYHAFRFLLITTYSMHI